MVVIIDEIASLTPYIGDRKAARWEFPSSPQCMIHPKTSCPPGICSPSGTTNPAASNAEKAP
jgi:hypothetical protein